MPVCSLDALLECLAIEATNDLGYTAPNLELPYHRIFGGQLVAQAIAIATADGNAAREGRGEQSAEKSVPKSVKSIHVTFPRPGDLREPVRYQVTRVHDGRTFSSRFTLSRPGSIISARRLRSERPNRLGRRTSA